MYIEGNSQPKYAMYGSMRAYICMCICVYANVYNNVSRLMCGGVGGEMEGGGMPLVCARELGGRWVRKGGGGIMATLCPTYKG